MNPASPRCSLGGRTSQTLSEHHCLIHPWQSSLVPPTEGRDVPQRPPANMTASGLHLPCSLSMLSCPHNLIVVFCHLVGRIIDHQQRRHFKLSERSIPNWNAACSHLSEPDGGSEVLNGSKIIAPQSKACSQAWDSISRTHQRQCQKPASIYQNKAPEKQKWIEG